MKSENSNADTSIPRLQKCTLLLYCNYLPPNWSQFNRDKNHEGRTEEGSCPRQWNVNLGSSSLQVQAPVFEMRISSASMGLWMPRELALERQKWTAKVFLPPYFLPSILLTCSSNSTMEQCSQLPPTPGATPTTMREWCLQGSYTSERCPNFALQHRKKKKNQRALTQYPSSHM